MQLRRNNRGAVKSLNTLRIPPEDPEEAISPEIVKLPPGPEREELRFDRKRRRGRGRLITVGPAPLRGRQNQNAEEESETTYDKTDQRLSEFARKSTASPHNESIQREQTKAADTVEDIQSHVTPKNREVLSRVLSEVAAGDSIREIARETGLYPMQVLRARDDARKVYAEGARQKKREPFLTGQLAEYKPRGVRWKDFMATTREPAITFFEPDKRTSVGRDVGPGSNQEEPSQQQAADVSPEAQLQREARRIVESWKGCEHRGDQLCPKCQQRFARLKEIGRKLKSHKECNTTMRFTINELEAESQRKTQLTIFKVEGNMAVPEHDKSYQDKPLIAVLVSPDGPEEIWVLGRENGQAAPEDIELGNSWYERLRTLQAARQADFNQA